MYTLVVVDMQPEFEAASGEYVVNNCLRQIKTAIECDAHIIYLEYSGSGDTLPELKEPVEKYKHHYIEKKFTDDGSAEVQNAVNKNGLMIGRFRVVGVNTDWCIKSTVEGLRKRFPTSFVEVVVNACSSHDNHVKGIKLIEKIPHVDLI